MYKLGLMEKRFADIIWEKEPVSTKCLIKTAEEQFQWKPTTAYTVLKRLSDKGLFQNRNSIVTSLVSKEEYYENDASQYIDETFCGSLPAFLTAFTSGKKVSEKEARELKKLLDDLLKEADQSDPDGHITL